MPPRGTTMHVNGDRIAEISKVAEFISIKLSAAKEEDEPGMMEGTAEVPHPMRTPTFQRRLRSLTL
jgi:hypothetical protein